MFGSSLLVAGRAGSWMDLTVAVEQRTAILDVGGQAVDRRRRQRPNRQRAGFQRAQEVAVRLPEGHTEGRRDGGEVRLSGGLDTGLPGLEAVDISRLGRERRIRMAATRLAAILDVDTEDHPFRTIGPWAIDVVLRRDPANAREDERIGWRGTRLRSAHLVISRVAHRELVDQRTHCRRD